jgi:outer membrane protein assembly factor BamB
MRRSTAAVAAILFTLALPVLAEDWNGWRGPHGNGLAAKSPRLIDQLPGNGLPAIWVIRDIPAAGWGSPAIADGRVYFLTHTRKQKPDSEFPPRAYPEIPKEQREAMPPKDLEEYDRKRGEEERDRRRQDELTETLYCVDASRGAIHWKQAWPSVHTTFPHSNTPAVVSGRVYLLGAGLKARCFDASTGKLLWMKNLPGEFQDEQIDSSFAVTDDVAVVLANQLIGLDARIGEVLWTAPNTRGRESSPVVWSHQGAKQIVANVGGGQTAGFDPRTGNELWRVETQANVSTPVIAGDRMVTLSDQAEGGLRGFKLSANGAEPLWQVKRVADRGSSPVIVGEHVFAQSERKLVCVNLQSGDQEWQARLNAANPQYTSLLAADGKLFYTHDGVLCVAANADAHRILIQAKISHSGLLADEQTHRRHLNLNEVEAVQGGSEKARQTLEREVLSQGPLDCASPALADGRLVIRLKDGLVCYDLRRIEMTARKEQAER